MDDRRQFTRATDAQVQIHQCVVTHMGQEMWLDTSAIDMSAQGLCLLASQSRSPGEEMFILATVTAAGKAPKELSVTGISTYCRPHDQEKWRIGVKFSEMADWEVADWKTYLET